PADRRPALGVAARRGDGARSRELLARPLQRDGGGLLTGGARGGGRSESDGGEAPEGPRPLLLVGDLHLIRRRLAEIQAATVGDSPGFGTHEVLQGDRATLEDLATALRTVSLGGTRLVVLRQADKLRDEAQKAMGELLGAIAPKTHFVA